MNAHINFCLVINSKSWFLDRCTEYIYLYLYWIKHKILWYKCNIWKTMSQVWLYFIIIHLVIFIIILLSYCCVDNIFITSISSVVFNNFILLYMIPTTSFFIYKTKILMILLDIFKSVIFLKNVIICIKLSYVTKIENQTILMCI